MTTKKMYLVKNESVYHYEANESHTVGIFNNIEAARTAMKKEWDRELSFERDWSEICTEREITENSYEMWEEGRYGDNHLSIMIEELNIPIEKQTVYTIIKTNIKEIIKTESEIPEIIGTYSDREEALEEFLNVLQKEVPMFSYTNEKDRNYWKELFLKDQGNSTVAYGYLKISIIKNEINLPNTSILPDTCTSMQ